MEYVQLNDGNRIPSVGFGVFQIPAGNDTYEATLNALKAGYRHIDTAAAYFNEADVGKAVRDSGIPREEVFVTSKLWLQDFAYEDAKKAIDVSLDNLGLGYIDLYLLHQPYGKVQEAWRALEEAKAAGKIRSIGVSNFTPKYWNENVPKFKTLPAVNQVECNPYSQQRELRKILDPLNVVIEAWGPLGQGRGDLLTNPVVLKIAEAHGKNAGQVVIRFEIQDGIVSLPKSSNPERIRSNLDVFDFSLTDEEMEEMRKLDTGKTNWDVDAPGLGESLMEKYKIHD